MKADFIIGVDPGTPPTLAVLAAETATPMDFADGAAVGTQEKRGKTRKWYAQPSLIAGFLRPYATMRTLIVIEQVGPMPKQGISSACRFTGSMYMMQGMCAGLGVDYHMVTPQRWKKDMGLAGAGGDMEATRARALHLFPDASAQLKRKMDHDRAAALLMAEWGRITLT